MKSNVINIDNIPAVILKEYPKDNLLQKVLLKESIEFVYNSLIIDPTRWSEVGGTIQFKVKNSEDWVIRPDFDMIAWIKAEGCR